MNSPLAKLVALDKSKKSFIAVCSEKTCVESINARSGQLFILTVFLLKGRGGDEAHVDLNQMRSE